MLRADNCAQTTYLITATAVLDIPLHVVSSQIRVYSSIIHDVVLIRRPRARNRVRAIRLRKGVFHAELDGSERGPMVTVWPRIGMQDLN